MVAAPTISTDSTVLGSPKEQRAPKSFPRALFFDLDGTLLAPGSVLTERTKRAAHAVAARGAQLVLATGGFSYRTRLLARRLNVDGPPRTWAITHNGSAIWDPHGTLVYQEVLPPQTVRALLRSGGSGAWLVMEAATANGRTAMYEAGRSRSDMHPFVWGPEPPSQAPDAVAMLGEAATTINRAHRAESAHIEGVLGAWAIGTRTALQDMDALAVNGVLLGARYLEWTRRLGEILDRPRLQVEGRDIGPLGASKGTAARWLCERLGIPRAATAAFGDADNDTEMLKFVAYGVAMGNATPDLIALAQQVAPTNREDGVAQVLEAWLDLPDS
jgi:HAD superfamily hydrolase (TIGR01484 family)